MTKPMTKKGFRAPLDTPDKGAFQTPLNPQFEQIEFNEKQ